MKITLNVYNLIGFEYLFMHFAKESGLCSLYNLSLI